MASSFITKDDVHGFWIQDSLMQVICWGLVNVIDETPINNENHWLKKEFREHVFNNSQGIFIGFMHLSLDEFLTELKHRELFIDILSKTKEFFLNKGECISTEDLNDFQLIKKTKHEWITPLKTEKLVKVLNYIADVVNDKIDIVDISRADFEL